jgi:ATP-binding cassette subfamily C protein/ATP-binding cassette subfamily C protein EexD
MLLKDGAVELFGPRADVLKRLMTRPRPADIPPGGAVQRFEGSSVVR